MTGPFRPPTGGPAGTPGQGGPQPVHPTVGNFGLPGGGGPPQGQTFYNQPPQPAAEGWRMPPAPAPQGQTFEQAPQAPQYPAQPAPQGYTQPAAPQNQPHPTASYGQPQPGFQPAQQPQNQPPQRADIPDHVILDGAGVPPELRGRSWGQVKQIYGALANDFIMRQGGQPQPAPQPQGRQSFQNQPAPVYEQGRANGGQPPQARQGGTFWEDPEGTIGRIVDNRLAPVTQRTTAMAIQEARQVARMSIPDFDYLEGEIMSIVQGADGQALTDPRLWQSTAELARGRMMGQNRYDPRAAQQSRNGQQPNQPGGDPNFARGPGSYVPAPVSPIGSFFTEAPTPPQYPNQSYNGGQNGDVQQRVAALSPDQRAYAAKMQMTPEEYVGWMGGVQPVASTRRY